MKTVTMLAGGASLLLATQALAQDAPAPETDAPEVVEEAPPAVEPAPPVDVAPQIPPAPPRAFTDEEVSAFVAAALRMRAMASDDMLDDVTRQSMADAVLAENGLDAATYAAIGEAAGSDPLLAQRIQREVERVEAEAGD